MFINLYSYLTSRYSQKSAVSQEANQFREVRHEKLKQKLTEKKQLATSLVNNQRTRPKTLLHMLANYRAQGSNPEEVKFPLLRQFPQKTEVKKLPKSSSEPSIPTPKVENVPFYKLKMGTLCERGWKAIFGQICPQMFSQQCL